MRAVVFAYHNMGVVGLRKLMSHGFEIPLVFTHDDSVGENIWFDSVAELCRATSIEYVSPENPNSGEWIERVRQACPDIIFSFYYRSMLSPEILALAPLGAYNLHGSLLPAYRGRCPVNWVLINGEEHTGVTLHEMIEKPDAGPIVSQARVDVAPDDTALTLFRKLEAAAGRLLDEVLPGISRGNIPKTPQDLSRGSYYGGRKPEDGRIHWNRSAREISNLIRGVTRPYPGAFGNLCGRKILFWQAAAMEGKDLSPGLIACIDGSVLIGTGKGVLVPLEAEAEGRVFKDAELINFFSHFSGECMT